MGHDFHDLGMSLWPLCRRQDSRTKWGQAKEPERPGFKSKLCNFMGCLILSESFSYRLRSLSSILLVMGSQVRSLSQVPLGLGQY